jgi:hypothetical protein
LNAGAGLDAPAISLVAFVSLTNPIQVSSICATFAMAISGVWKIARRSPGLRLLNPSDESEVRRAGK